MANIREYDNNNPQLRRVNNFEEKLPQVRPYINPYGNPEDSLNDLVKELMPKKHSQKESKSVRSKPLYARKNEVDE
jgi:hypothetical protein